MNFIPLCCSKTLLPNTILIWGKLYRNNICQGYFRDNCTIIGGNIYHTLFQVQGLERMEPINTKTYKYIEVMMDKSNQEVLNIIKNVLTGLLIETASVDSIIAGIEEYIREMCNPLENKYGELIYHQLGLMIRKEQKSYIQKLINSLKHDNSPIYTYKAADMELVVFKPSSNAITISLYVTSSPTSEMLKLYELGEIVDTICYKTNLTSELVLDVIYKAIGSTYIEEIELISSSVGYVTKEALNEWKHYTYRYLKDNIIVAYDKVLKFYKIIQNIEDIPLSNSMHNIQNMRERC